MHGRENERHLYLIATCFHENQPWPVRKALASFLTAQSLLKPTVTRLPHISPTSLSMWDWDLAVSASFRGENPSSLTQDLPRLCWCFCGVPFLNLNRFLVGSDACNQNWINQREMAFFPSYFTYGWETPRDE